MKSIFAYSMASVCLAALAAPVQAVAQEAAAQPAEPEAEAGQPVVNPAPPVEDDGETVVVVGTLIRGTQVVGSQTITVGAEAITEKGATSTNELLGLIPQIANTFNGRFEVDPRGLATGSSSITRPNLRALPSSNTTSGSLTLLLADGMRITPVGVNAASVDADIVPSAVMAGIDVVTDGGSSLYGADAVAGVINFRTLRKFDGIKVDGNYGFGTEIKAYKTWDATITAGTSWDGGNAYISAGKSVRDLVLNGDTDWSNGLVFNTAGVGAPNYTQCLSPVGTQIVYRYLNIPGVFTGWTNNPAAGGATIPIGTACDRSLLEAYSPKQERTNVFAAVSQEFGDIFDLRVTGYWTKRETTLANFPRGYTTPAQPAPVGAPGSPGAPASSPATILGGTGFSFGANAAYENPAPRNGYKTWGITPELTVKLGSNWQLRNSIHYGRSTNFQRFPDIDAIKAQCYISGNIAGNTAPCNGITGGQLNPLNVAAASAAVITDITNFENAQDTKHKLFVARSIADGTLFSLMGRDVKLAAGVEYQVNWAASRLASGPFDLIDSQPYESAKRNAKSVFAEVLVPVTDFLDVNGSIRYDHYSDFGSTTNPNIGATIKPTSWLKFFGHWNTSYNAPTAIDTLAIGTGRYVCGIYDAGGPRRPNDPLGRDTSLQGTCAMVLQGSRPGLEPQTAKSWAVGFEATPGNFRFGGEFYSIDAKNTLGTLNPSVTSTYITNPDLYTYNVNSADYAALLASLTNGAALGAQQPAASNIAIIVDTRISNLNAAKIEGFDFHGSYKADTSIGQFTVGIAGTRRTKSFETNGGVSADRLGIGGPKLSATTFASYDTGGLSSRITVNYTGKFTDEANNYLGFPDKADPFIVTNLFLGYDFKDSDSFMRGLSLRFIVDNVFNETPQYVRRANTNNPTYLNWTLGRTIKLGASFKI